MLLNLNKNILVLGLGKTGISAVNFFLNLHIKVYVYDDNKECMLNFIKNNNVEYCDNLDGIDYLFISPGIPYSGINQHFLVKEALERNIKCLSDIEILQMYYNDIKSIAVTGTNGKSTTVSLIDHILNYNSIKAKICGNIGIPVLSINYQKNITYILELSSYNLDLIEYSDFDINILINITSNHTTVYPKMIDYQNAKSTIFQHKYKKNTYNIISLDYIETNNIYNMYQDKVQFIPFSINRVLNTGVSLINDILNIRNCLNIPRLRIKINKSPALNGVYNNENIVCGIIVGLLKNISLTNIFKPITTFQGLPYRLQLVYTYKSLQFINDSKSTSINATNNAVSTYNHSDIYLIIGGVLQSTEIELLKKVVLSVKYVYLIGSTTDFFAQELNIRHFEKSYTLDNALFSIKNTVTSGVILFSPGCASYDQWSNFEERGMAFNQIVKQLWCE